ncbi:MAG: ATP-binding protein [Desulfobacterales bacterium]|nr:ATP-binding protein [Desulfobacterales bacterium]
MSVVKKAEFVKKEIVDRHGCNGLCAKCARSHRMVDLMVESSIPVGYWFLTMEKFTGAPKLKEITTQYIDEIQDNYMSGNSVCFAGNQGTGKTMSSICILKKAIKKGFSAHYTTASDILNKMTERGNGATRDVLRESDFLVIDELDSRFFVSDSAKELFSGIYENIFRFRSHNMLPTIICTNETDGILNIFYGASVQSINSLNHQYLKTYPVVGQDFRRK